MSRISIDNGTQFIVDDIDLPSVSRYSWRLCTKRKYLRAETRVRGKRVRFLLHRYILGLSDSNVIVDHIDRNPLNNSRSNLRICDNSKNQANRPPKSNKKFKGVYYRPNKNAFVAEIVCNGKRYYLGFFRSEEDAAIAYNIKAKELFGEFALLNQINTQVASNGGLGFCV